MTLCFTCDEQEMVTSVVGGGLRCPVCDGCEQCAEPLVTLVRSGRVFCRRDCFGREVPEILRHRFNCTSSAKEKPTNITEMGPHAYMSVDEMLAYAVRDHGMADALLMGYDKRNGRLIILSSNLTRAQANFMIDKAKLWTLEELKPEE